MHPSLGVVDVINGNDPIGIFEVEVPLRLDLVGVIDVHHFDQKLELFSLQCGVSCLEQQLFVLAGGMHQFRLTLLLHLVGLEVLVSVMLDSLTKEGLPYAWVSKEHDVFSLANGSL